jgi:hypothetical protein
MFLQPEIVTIAGGRAIGGNSSELKLVAGFLCGFSERFGRDLRGRFAGAEEMSGDIGGEGAVPRRDTARPGAEHALPAARSDEQRPSPMGASEYSSSVRR